MKKIYLMALAAMLVMSMSSCSSDDEPNGKYEPSTTAIDFGSYLERDVVGRAESKPKVPDFGVFAFYTGQTSWQNYASKDTANFMSNQEVDVSSNSDAAGSWLCTYSPVKYWPNNPGDKLSFFAYAPYDKSAKWCTSKDSCGYLAYTIPNTIKDQKDILVCVNNSKNSSNSLIDVTKSDTENNNKITFNFKHALSQIGFEVAYSKDGANVEDSQEDNALDKSTKVQIKSVKIGDDDTNGFYKAGKLNLTAPNVAWAGTTGSQAFTLTSDNFAKNVADSVTGSWQELNADYLLVIPQDFSTTKLPVEIVYTVTTKDASLPQGESVVTNTIKTDASVNFEAGKAYTLRLRLGLSTITTAAKEDKWVSADRNYTVPDEDN